VTEAGLQQGIITACSTAAADSWQLVESHLRLGGGHQAPGSGGMVAGCMCGSCCGCVARKLALRGGLLQPSVHDDNRSGRFSPSLLELTAGSATANLPSVKPPGQHQSGQAASEAGARAGAAEQLQTGVKMAGRKDKRKGFGNGAETEWHTQRGWTE